MSTPAVPADRKTAFFKAYANLPDVARDDIVAVVDTEPYTWRSAKLEIDQDTDLGRRILDSLTALDILP